MTRANLAAAMLAVVCAVAPLPSCQSTPEGEWVEIEVAAASERVLWQVALQAMDLNGWKPGPEQGSAYGRAQSSWRVELQPFRGDGTRDRCHVEMLPGTVGRWILRARVEVEANEELAKPLDITYAQWKPVADDTQAAKRVLQHVQALLRAPPEPQAAPRPRTD